MLNCILCKSEDIIKVESLKKEDLKTLYKKKFGISVALNSDPIYFYSCSNCGLKFFYPIESGDESFYESLQKFDWYYMQDKPEFEIVIPWLKEADSVLEVGAGTGSFAEYAELKRYTGLEFNDAAISEAYRQGRTLLKESIQQHASKGGQYDAVVCFQVLEHVPNVQEFLKNCIDCVKPGGRLIVAVPSHDGFCGSTTNNALDMPPHHITHWSKRSLESVADIFGVMCISIEHEPIASYHFDWAQKTLMLKKIKKRLGIKNKLLDLSMMHQVLSKVVILLSYIINIELNGVKGHSVIGVYQKES